MNSEVPLWIQVLQALATPAIALLAAVIAFFQWRTARQKIVVDLFDRRMTIYTDCRDILQPIVANPSKTTMQNGIEFRRASADAEFLFDDDVFQYLRRVEEAVFNLATAEAELKATVGPEHTDLVASRRAAIETVTGFYTSQFQSLLKPYMWLGRRRQW